MKTSHETDNRAGWGMVWAIGLTVVVLLICTVVTDGGGVQPEEHREGVPAGVTQLSPRAYIVQEDAPMEVAEICKATVAEAERVVQVKTIKELRADYVECGADQVWNATGKSSPNFGGALLSTLQNPWWIAGEVAILLVCFFPALFSLMGDWRTHRRATRALPSMKERKELLTTQWAKGELDDVQFEEALAKLVRNGA